MNTDTGHTSHNGDYTRRSGAGILRRFLKAMAWMAGVWFFILVILQVTLSSAVLTRLVNRFASEYIDGTLSFGKVRLTMFRHFPNIGVSLEDCSLTYPAERFDSLETAGSQGYLLRAGSGETADTLASFKHFSAGINIGALVTGKIRIPHIILSQPRIYAHRYDEDHANWNIFGSSDTSKTTMPPVIIGRIRLVEHPHIVYTDSRDTLFAMMDVRKMAFDGKWDTGKGSIDRAGLNIDSLILGGRMSADTIGLRLSRLHIQEENRHLDLIAEANTMLATGAFGRMAVPISIEGRASFPKDTVPSVEVESMKIEVASIPLSIKGTLRRAEGQTEVDGSFAIEGCKANEVLKGFIRNIIPETEKIRTDAVISMDGICKGMIGNGIYPAIQAQLRIPDSHIGHKSLQRDIRISLDACASTDSVGRISLSVNGFNAQTHGLSLKVKGAADDITGNDPLINIDGSLSADIPSLAEMHPGSESIKAEGEVAAHLKGSIHLSQISIYNFAQASIEGFIESDGFVFDSPADSVSIAVKGIDVKIGPESRASTRDGSSTLDFLAISGAIDSTSVTYGSSMSFKGKSVEFSAKNSAEAFSERDTSKIYPLGGHLKASALSLKDTEGLSISLDNTSNSFLMMPKKGHPEVPVLSVRSTNKRIFVRDLSSRCILTDASVKAKAAMNTAERRTRRRQMMDSLAVLYPHVQQDSLLSHHLRVKRSAELPQWMTEEDFKAKDIRLSLNESFARYFREWDIEGSLNVRTGIIMTPYFPLRNILDGADVTFDNNELRLNKFKLRAGTSEIAMNGSLSGLRRALLGRGTYSLDMDISSEKMDADALIAAFNAGAGYDPKSEDTELAEASDAEFLQIVTADSLLAEQTQKLIVIPANLNADIALNARNIKYSGLKIDNLASDIIMKERCMQILNTSVSTNVGKGSFEGFYSTRTKKDIHTGFNLELKDITTEKVISMMPAIDTIMPLLKSFKGLVDCELAATASLDTNMNVVMPSINGVVRIDGENLSMSGEKVFTDLAKKLKFKDKEEGRIDRMTVEGIIRDNTIEVFPFIVDIDRYTLAMSGKHNLDQSFRYHVSLIKSPMVFKIGIDLYGPDFDSMKFKIGKPKYKNTKVPVFTEVIDQTRINLAESIKGIFEKGVEAAVKENEKQDAISAHKQEIGYVNAVDQQIEELSENEKKQLEENSETKDTKDE